MKSQRFVFVKKKHAKGGREATILAAVSAVLFVAAIIISWFSGGKAGVIVGGMALVACLLGIFGFVVGMKSFQEPDVSPLFSIIGSIGSGVIVVIWLTLFLAGIR
ncbi:MAG: DUF6142 family protein [Lachnospiraceae bacterium]|nr:DUF6142 family protein [Lachnospiraceae bacterium]